MAGSIAGSAIAYLCKGTLVPGLGLGLGLGLGSGHARAWVALRCGSGVAAQKAEKNRLEAARARCPAARTWRGLYARGAPWPVGRSVAVTGWLAERRGRAGPLPRGGHHGALCPRGAAGEHVVERVEWDERREA